MDTADYQYKGPVIVRYVNSEERLRWICQRPHNGFILYGCAYGGVKKFGGVSGKCVVYLRSDARPDHLAHELAHCAGMEHP